MMMRMQEKENGTMVEGEWKDGRLLPMGKYITQVGTYLLSLGTYCVRTRARVIPRPWTLVHYPCRGCSGAVLISSLPNLPTHVARRRLIKPRTSLYLGYSL